MVHPQPGVDGLRSVGLLKERQPIKAEAGRAPTANADFGTISGSRSSTSFRRSLVQLNAYWNTTLFLVPPSSIERIRLPPSAVENVTEVWTNL